jgi:hypothetical protein
MTRFEAIWVLLLVTAFDPSIAIQREDNKEKKRGSQTKHQDTKVGNVEIDHQAQDQGIADTESAADAGRSGPPRTPRED